MVDQVWRREDYFSVLVQRASADEDFAFLPAAARLYLLRLRASYPPLQIFVLGDSHRVTVTKLECEGFRSSTS